MKTCFHGIMYRAIYVKAQIFNPTLEPRYGMIKALKPGENTRHTYTNMIIVILSSQTKLVEHEPKVYKVFLKEDKTPIDQSCPTRYARVKELVHESSPSCRRMLSSSANERCAAAHLLT